MSLLYKRTEDNVRVRIEWNSWLGIIYILLFCNLILAIVAHIFITKVGSYLDLSIVGLLLYIITIRIATYNIRKEFNKAMRDSYVKVSGERFSIKNPMVIEIPKGTES